MEWPLHCISHICSIVLYLALAALPVDMEILHFPQFALTPHASCEVCTYLLSKTTSREDFRENFRENFQILLNWKPLENLHELVEL